MIKKCFLLMLGFIALWDTTVWAQATDSIRGYTYIPPEVEDSIRQAVIDSIRQAYAEKPVTLDSPGLQKTVSAPADGGYLFKGRVKDRNSGEGIPFATLFFKGSHEGTTADIDGFFELRTAAIVKDTLSVTAIGYETFHRKINIQQRATTGMLIELLRGEQMLNEVVFKAGEDPAITLVKNIIKHKARNNPDRLSNYRYEVYNKLEVDIERLSREQFEALPLMKPFGFIYDNLDSTSEEVPFLPFYLTETISNYYFQAQPKKAKEFIVAAQLKGISNESITKFLGAMYQNVNVYDNYIPVMDKEFVSPVSNTGLFYYKYKILDTQQAYGHKIILVQYAQRRGGENCFFGDFWVVDSIYALQRVNLQLPKSANINWLSRVTLYQEFAPVDDSVWFCIRDKFSASFVGPYGVKLPGFIGRKSTSYNNIAYNHDSITAVLNNPKFRDDVIVLSGSKEKTEDFWVANRHDSLTKNEQAIYNMIDTLESLPVFQRTKNFIKFTATGIKEWGPLELGPVWSLYSRNPVEGNRFRLNLGSTPQLFKNIYLNGYAAYGTTDERWKHKASALWIMNRSPRMYMYMANAHDVDNTTTYYDEAASDNLFSIAVRKKGIPWKLAFVKDTRVEWFKEYFSGFSHKLTVLHKEFTPYEPLPQVFVNDEGISTNTVTNTEINVHLRFAYLEKFLEGNYYRVSLGSDYPLIELRFGVGVKGFWNSAYNYQKLTFSIADNARIAPLGTLYYNLFAGKYFGTLPYPLLEIHPGNEYHVYNRRAFNMMNRYEFISDEYVGVNLEHNIGGSFFNYVPLLKKLKMRVVGTAKGVIGNLSDENAALNTSNSYTFKTLKGNPYVEVGAGLENILQFFRIDFVWRVMPPPNVLEPRSKRFGIFGSIKFAF